MAFLDGLDFCPFGLTAEVPGLFAVGAERFWEATRLPGVNFLAVTFLGGMADTNTILTV